MLCVRRRWSFLSLPSTKMIFNLDKLLIFSRNRKHSGKGAMCVVLAPACHFNISAYLRNFISLSNFNEKKIPKIQRNSFSVCSSCVRTFKMMILLALPLPWHYIRLRYSSRARPELSREFFPFFREGKINPSLIFEDSTVYQYKLIFHPSLSSFSIWQNTSPSTPTPTFISSHPAAEQQREKHMKNPTLRKKNIKTFLEKGKKKKRVLCSAQKRREAMCRGWESTRGREGGKNTYRREIKWNHVMNHIDLAFFFL